MAFVVRKNGESGAYSGPTCLWARVDPAKRYEDRLAAEEDAMRLTSYNPTGFEVVEAAANEPKEDAVPDLTEHLTATCSSNMEWKASIRGSVGDYVVSYTAQEGWSCSCPSFTYRGSECKHIKQTKESHARCGWNAELEPIDLNTLEKDGDNLLCPDCGEPVALIKVKV